MLWNTVGHTPHTHGQRSMTTDARHPDDIWLTVIAHLSEIPDLKEFSRVNRQLARLTQPVIFQCIVFRSSSKADELHALIVTNPHLSSETTTLRLVSGYSRELLRWFQSDRGVLVLQHLDAVTELILDETDFRSVEVIESFKHITAYNSGMTTLRILHAWLPKTDTVRSMVVQSLLNSCGSLEVLQATATIPDPLQDVTDSDGALVAGLGINASNQAHTPDLRLRELKVYGAKDKAENPLTLAIHELVPWLLISERCLHIKTMDLLISSREDLTAFLQIYRQTAKTLQVLRLTFYYELQFPHDDNGNPLEGHHMPDFSIIPPLVHAHFVEIGIFNISAASDSFIPPLWLAELLQAILPGESSGHISQSLESEASLSLHMDFMGVIFTPDSVEAWNALDQAACRAEQFVLSGLGINNWDALETVAVLNKCLPICSAQGSLVVDAAMLRFDTWI